MTRLRSAGLNEISHILKAIAALILAAAGFFALRSLIVPDSFGVQHSYIYGYYRAAADAEQAAQPVLYQGSSACPGCHAQAVAGSVHPQQYAAECRTVWVAPDAAAMSRSAR